jgi:hypothetical protein
MIEALEQKVDSIVPVTPTLWAWAEILGAARTGSNDTRRHRSADRGAGNAKVDLTGAFGELLLLDWVTKLYPPEVAAEMAAHLYHPDGGDQVKGADLRLKSADGHSIVGIDAKSFDCAPNKRRFAINARKHRDLGGLCQYYFCVLATPYGTKAAVSRLVPYAEVETWSAEQLRATGSASRNLDLNLFLKRQFTRPPSLSWLRAERHPPAQIDSLRRDPACRADLRRLIPRLPQD